MKVLLIALLALFLGSTTAMAQKITGDVFPAELANTVIDYDLHGNCADLKVKKSQKLEKRTDLQFYRTKDKIVIQSKTEGPAQGLTIGDKNYAIRPGGKVEIEYYENEIVTVSSVYGTVIINDGLAVENYGAKKKFLKIGWLITAGFFYTKK